MGDGGAVAVPGLVAGEEGRRADDIGSVPIVLWGMRASTTSRNAGWASRQWVIGVSIIPGHKATDRMPW